MPCFLFFAVFYFYIFCFFIFIFIVFKKLLIGHTTKTAKRSLNTNPPNFCLIAICNADKSNKLVYIQTSINVIAIVHCLFIVY